MRLDPATPFVLARARVRRRARWATLREQAASLALLSLPMTSFVVLAAFGDTRLPAGGLPRAFAFVALFPLAMAFVAGLLLAPGWFGAVARLGRSAAAVPAMVRRDAVERTAETALRTGVIPATWFAGEPAVGDVMRAWQRADPELVRESHGLVVRAKREVRACPRCGGGLERESPSVLRCGYCEYEKLESLALPMRAAVGERSLRFSRHLFASSPWLRRVLWGVALSWPVHAASFGFGSLAPAYRGPFMGLGFVLGVVSSVLLGVACVTVVRAYLQFAPACVARLAAVREGLIDIVEREGVVSFTEAATTLGVTLDELRLALDGLRRERAAFHVDLRAERLLHASFAELDADCARCGDRRRLAELGAPCPSCGYRAPRAALTNATRGATRLGVATRTSRTPSAG